MTGHRTSRSSTYLAILIFSFQKFQIATEISATGQSAVRGSDSFSLYLPVLTMVNTGRSTKKSSELKLVTHPILEIVDRLEAIQFLRDRERYELKISQRESDGVPMVPATYCVSIKPNLLGLLDDIAPSVEVHELTEEHLKEFL